MNHNLNIIGKTFASWKGMGATYINTKKVPEGFRIICESMPHDGHDHIAYGRRVDGEYIGVGQPYPRRADQICEINKYCCLVGLDMFIGGGSTWHPSCMRILFQRDDDNIERFNIAVNCSRWHDSFLLQGHTEKIIKGVNRRFNQRYPMATIDSIEEVI